MVLLLVLSKSPVQGHVWRGTPWLGWGLPTGLGVRTTPPTDKRVRLVT